MQYITFEYIFFEIAFLELYNLYEMWAEPLRYARWIERK